MKKRFLPIIIAISIIFIIATLFAFLYNPYKSGSSVQANINWCDSPFTLSTMALVSDTFPWNEFEGKKIHVNSDVAYVKITIKNPSPNEKDYFIVNNDINSKCNGYETLSFEMIPLSNIHERLNKAVFRVLIPAYSERTFILEFNSKSPIYLNPIILDEIDFYRVHTNDLYFLMLMYSVSILFVFYSIIQFIILRNQTYYFSAGISVAIICLYAIKTKYFVFWFGPSMVPLCYPGYLMNAIGRICCILSFIVITFLFITNFKKISLNWKYFYICFIPWYIVAVLESAGYIFKIQIISDYSGLFVYIMCQITFSIMNIFSDKTLQREKQEELISYFTYNHKISFEELISTKTISTQFLVIIREQLQQPLEVISAISNMMEKTQDYSKIVAYSKAIEEYILQMKNILGLELLSADRDKVLKSQPSVTNLDMQKEFNNSEFDEYKNAAICIYGNRSKMDLSLKMILSSEGFFCIENDSKEKIVDDIKNGKIQMLVIDPASTGDEAFDLCRRIREEFNMLQLPVIMIINYYANHLVRAGYSAGVNDFVIRPFDSAELVSRCYLLLQQHKTFIRNKELARMENEKSTFLYFVTHNVNTPLTLLLNRMDELSASMAKLNVDSEIIDDMSESVNEINDIIQNVLISFRISDGRFINTQENLFIEDVLDTIRPQIEAKAKNRNVKIDWNISELLPQVHCNKQALRGIMVNLLDNAVKYAREDGYVQVYAGNINGRIKFSVSDDGMGVDSDKISSLFTRFESVAKDYNKNRPSVGLGLYVANELAKMNGITIEYTDADIGGACFSMIFPA